MIYSCIQDPPLLLSALTVFLQAQRLRPEHWAFCAAVSFGYLRAEISRIWERLVDGEMAFDFGGLKTVTSTPIRAPLKGASLGIPYEHFGDSHRACPFLAGEFPVCMQ